MSQAVKHETLLQLGKITQRALRFDSRRRELLLWALVGHIAACDPEAAERIVGELESMEER